MKANEPKKEGQLAAAIEPMVTATAELEELFRTHHHRALKAAYRITGSMADAEDVAQAVFLRVAKPRVCREAIANPESYIYRAAINGALDLLRRRHREAAVPIDAAGELAGSTRLEQASEARQMTALLRGALAKVSARAAEMFVLRYVEERDLGEIAHLLDTSRAVVAVTLHRTRSRLRNELRAHSTRGER